MRRSYFKGSASAIAAVGLACILGAGADLSAQGRGRGNGGGDRGGKRGGEHQQAQRQQNGGDRSRNARQPQIIQARQPQRRADNQPQFYGGPQRRESGQQRQQMMQQARRQQESRRLQERSDRESKRQQQWSDWNSRRQQAQSDQRSRMQQQRSDRNSHRQQDASDRIARMQQMASARNSRRQQEWSEQRSRDRNPRVRIWDQGRRDDDDRRWRDSRRRNEDRGDQRRTEWRERGDFPWGLGSYNGYKNYGHYRRAQVHARNADRKAAQDWNAHNGYNDRYYYEMRYSVIRNIVRDRVYTSSYYDNSSYYPSYGNYYYGTRYEPVYGSPLTINYIYYGLPYPYQPQVSYVYMPQYGSAYYDPYSYGSYSNYGYDPYYSNYSYPAYYDAGYGYNDSSLSGILSRLPVGELVSELAGNSFLGELLGSFLTQGYDQGYMDAQYAREYGYGESNYYDPYAYHDTSYDTYSSNLAENRRIFSEGYEAGYRDAMMARNDEYHPYEDRQPDLIGLLVGNVLSGI